MFFYYIVNTLDVTKFVLETITKALGDKEDIIAVNK